MTWLRESTPAKLSLTAPDSVRVTYAGASHCLVIDQKGHAWLNADGALIGVDPRTDTVFYYRPPAGIGAVGGTLDVDYNGMIWASSRQGAVRFDPVTGVTLSFPHANTNSRHSRRLGIQ